MVVRTKKNSHEIREPHATMGISFWNVGMFFFPNKSLEKESHHILPLRFNQIFWLLSVIRLIFFSCSLLSSTKTRGADQIQCFWNNTFSPVELNANKKIASTPLNKTNAFVLVVTQKPFYFLDNSFFCCFNFSLWCATNAFCTRIHQQIIESIKVNSRKTGCELVGWLKIKRHKKVEIVEKINLNVEFIRKSDW